jgi:DNA-binding transcriptional ArsR family regulator
VGAARVRKRPSAERGQLTVGELAAEFPDLVASGISKHLMELRAAGLVHAERQGRQQLYRINGPAFADALAPLLALYEPYWTHALERLRDLAEGGRPPDPHNGSERSPKVRRKRVLLNVTDPNGAWRLCPAPAHRPPRGCPASSPY